MQDDSATLALGGTVSLDAFASAAQAFGDLLTQLTTDTSPEARVDWEVADLQYGSAVMTARGVARDIESELVIPQVVDRYLATADSTINGVQSESTAASRRLIEKITLLVNDGIDEVRFENAEREVVFTEAASQESYTKESAAPSLRAQAGRPTRALGSVRGRIQTLQARGGLKFTIYDSVHDKAVSCYLGEGQEDMMRDSWDRLAEVEGMVSRSPVDDRPVSVRQITSVRVIDEAGSDDYRHARGAVAPSADAPASESIIRKLRDVG